MSALQVWLMAGASPAFIELDVSFRRVKGRWYVDTFRYNADTPEKDLAPYTTGYLEQKDATDLRAIARSQAKRSPALSRVARTMPSVSGFWTKVSRVRVSWVEGADAAPSTGRFSKDEAGWTIDEP